MCIFGADEGVLGFIVWMGGGRGGSSIARAGRQHNPPDTYTMVSLIGTYKGSFGATSHHHAVFVLPFRTVPLHGARASITEASHLSLKVITGTTIHLSDYTSICWLSAIVSPMQPSLFSCSCCFCSPYFAEVGGIETGRISEKRWLHWGHLRFALRVDTCC